jgi:hypothetical protein
MLLSLSAAASSVIWAGMSVPVNWVRNALRAASFSGEVVSFLSISFPLPALGLEQRLHVASAESGAPAAESYRLQ